MKKTLTLLLTFTFLLTLLAGCSGSETEEAKPDQSALYEQVMSRFDGNLEQGAVVKVLDPNGNQVTLAKNAFVPEIAGDYTVKVDATDDYGNQAETLQYVISVVDAETSSSSETPDTSEPIVSESDKDSVDHSESSSSGGETETPAKKGCGGSVVAASSFVGLILALGAAIAIKKRK